MICIISSKVHLQVAFPLSQNSAPASSIVINDMIGLVMVGPSRKHGPNNADFTEPGTTAFTVPLNGIFWF